MGHRDVGYTSCPGKNLYALITEIRPLLAPRIGSVVPIENPRIGILEAVPPEDEVIFELKNTAIPPITTQPIVLQHAGKLIKIKLSYPHEDAITLS